MMQFHYSIRLPSFWSGRQYRYDVIRQMIKVTRIYSKAVNYLSGIDVQFLILRQKKNIIYNVKNQMK